MSTEQVVAALLFVLGITSTLSNAGCSTANSAERVDPIGPDRSSFEPVAAVLVRRCGSLDCHGGDRRNLRLYGFGGLRLLRSDGGVVLPDERMLQPAEIDADYEAVVGLEPEMMRLVVWEHGARPERLTLIRKARGLEEHKGKDAVTTGDDADRCIVSWLASATDVAACTRVIPLVDEMTDAGE